MPGQPRLTRANPAQQTAPAGVRLTPLAAAVPRWAEPSRALPGPDKKRRLRRTAPGSVQEPRGSAPRIRRFPRRSGAPRLLPAPTGRSGKENPTRKDAAPMKNKHKQTLSTLLLVLVFLVGLSLLLYPTVSDYWNSLHQSRAIASYAEQVATLDNAAYDALWAEARAYNDTLRTKTDRFTLTDEELAEYNATLNVPGTNVIGYIEIPKIDCYLPIYHGTDEATLQVGVGHLEGSSLPVGGAGTHCVLSGHRGLPSAKLFTDLDQLAEGDTFVLYVLDETLTYEVDQIRIVEPQEVDELAIEDGQDYCTLVTCTPYGINTHRLLVRGHRVENAETDQAAARVSADAMQVDTAAVAPLVAVPLLLLLLFGLLFKTRRRRRPRKPDPPDPKR